MFPSGTDCTADCHQQVMISHYRLLFSLDDPRLRTGY